MTDDLNPELPAISFDEVLAAVQDEENAFPARYLHRLSDLIGDELKQFAQLWPALSDQRRLGMLEDLELLAESDNVMDFEAINRIALRDKDAHARVTAIRALWPSEQQSLVPEFMRLLDTDENLAVRAQAAAALGRFIYLGELGQVRKDTLKQIEERLLDITSADEDPLIQRRALESLAYSARTDIAELIENAYENGEMEWVETALVSMGRSADDRWANLVMESLEDENPSIVREAAKAAGELELGDALTPLVELLKAEDSEVRLAAAWSLSQIGGQGVSRALEEMLEAAEDEDEVDLIENAIENLTFTDELSELNIMDFSPEDLEDFANPSTEIDLDEDLE
jgi:HEAT repeat protein